MLEQGVVRADILNKLNISVHGDYSAYNSIIGAACKQDAEFLAHLISYDFVNGQIKDTKIALPVITLGTREFPDDLLENSLAHLAALPPRELLKALRFAISAGVPAGRQKKLDKLVRRYLKNKEQEPGKWNRLAARHRRSLKSLYALSHAVAPEWVSAVLFGFKRDNDGNKIPLQYPGGSIFADIAKLGKMEAEQAAAVINKWHLSPLVVSGAMAGSKAQDSSSVVQASMEQMSDTEIVNRARSLEKKGLSKDDTLKVTFRKKVAKATTSKKATLKTSVAAEEVEDEGLRTMLKELQERQIQAQKDAGRGIDGNWLVISDCSASQSEAITLGVHVATAISKFVTGTVHLVFCNTDVTPYDVTGKSLEEVRNQAKYVTASGGTSYGVGLAWTLEKKLDLDGVVIVGDGGENSAPLFATAYEEYRRKKDKSLPVYLCQTYCDPGYRRPGSGGHPDLFANKMASAGLTFTNFDFTSGKVDYHSIPNIVQQFSANRFGMVEKVMACPLITLDQIIPIRELVTA